ncbi:Coenzyme F420 hydrogenase/dehydrogenase, beta subunit C-terminal domain [uncultured Duncaniella sp.]|uniref:Coenzyme F420 hydrogenase/dehydrogenase, beta subunit C-terminal domain n=2 Tax=Muribaculaceae TaxID=2005473 RepID=UPI0026351A51|nr:Coenzyme F420 hydrogenase/dehydrogenase, beta subunit C-terminal domain [uncultured Duncaniella sp.]
MPILADKLNCTGCTACASICPKNAIEMRADGMGFKYPTIDSTLCIECKLCEKKCPIIVDSSDVENSVIDSYAAQMRDSNQLMDSQSGGAFQSMATHVIRHGGIIYGAAFNKDLSVSHHRIDSYENLSSLYKSKYVQSDLGECFKHVINDLKDGRTVLFSGTPCQVAGLKKIIPNKNKDNLITIDLICHGVPAPYVYREYLKYQEKENGKEISKFTFRDKAECGWKTTRESMEFSDDEKIISYKYNFLFLAKDLLSRQACSRCQFCNTHRVSDITVGDCWGWEKLGRTDFDEYKGVSLILINTHRGKNAVKHLSENMNLIPIDLTKLMQRNLQKPTERPKAADSVARDFQAHGFEYIHKKYGHTKRNLLRYKIISYLNAVRRRIKKYFRI